MVSGTARVTWVTTLPSLLRLAVARSTPECSLLQWLISGLALAVRVTIPVPRLLHPLPVAERAEPTSLVTSPPNPSRRLFSYDNVPFSPNPVPRTWILVVVIPLVLSTHTLVRRSRPLMTIFIFRTKLFALVTPLPTLVVSSLRPLSTRRSR